jgi:tRNA(Ile2)-agmatinylcytidine synthase
VNPLKCRIGLDDTDHIEVGCTTSSFDHLLTEICERMECQIVERRLVRLWPFAQRRTRGNGALGAILEIPEDRAEKLEQICNEWFSNLLVEISNYPFSEISTSPCLVISFTPVPKDWYWDAVRKNVDSDTLLDEAIQNEVIVIRSDSTFGVVGACAAISWANNPNSSWELISWRDKSMVGTPRKVSSESVSELETQFPETFLNRDPTKGKSMIAPRTPCPVLYGIRGSSHSGVEKAHHWLQSRTDVEECHSFAIHRTNQLSDDHIASSLSGAVVSLPNETKGGHANISVFSAGQAVKLVAFSAGGPVNRLLRSLIPGDRITWAGLVSPDGSTHLERIKLDFATARIVGRPICCSRTMRSSGRDQGIRCISCGRIERKSWYCTDYESTIETPVGVWQEPSPSNRRHLSRPLSHGFPGTN